MFWIAFFICTGLIVYAGTRLAKYGDIIAEKTGLGRAWVGLVLMASVTSLPELVTGLSSVTFADAPDIAVGDVLGSCAFNMLIIALLDAMYRPMPLSTKAHQGHVLSAAFGLLLLSVAAAGLLTGEAMPQIGWVGPYSFVLIVIYLTAVRMVFSYERRKVAAFLKEMAEELKYKEVSLKKALVLYAAHALVVIAAALFLPEIGKRIAEASGLGQTFVGNILIAVSTSLPEVVVSVAAMKLGAVDMAIGNLFGSNIFNVFILALDDIFFTQGPLLAFASRNQMIPALAAMAMTAIAVIGLTYRAEKKRLFIAWDSIGIVAVYAMNAMFLYLGR